MTYATSPIDTLTAEYGTQLEAITPKNKCLIASAFYDHMANESPYYGIVESLHNSDPDGLLGEELEELLVQVADTSTAIDLSSFLCAIANQVAVHARQGDLG
jgi:hypothetical protein